MEASIEVSMYPLGREYIADIENFINSLKQKSSLRIEVNGMSTQIFGPYNEVMDLLTSEIKRSFEKHGKSVFVMKIIKGSCDI